MGNILTFDNGKSNVHTLTYRHASWRDLLCDVDGVELTYDNNANPTIYYNGATYNMSWIEGRRLATLTLDGAAYSYTYNEDGIRTRKVNADGTYINYLISNGRAIGETHYSASGSVTKYMRYTFDESGSVCGYSTSTNGTTWTAYYYVKNLQGDVIEVFRASDNTSVATFKYDSWGFVLSAKGTNATENPFRYRGYYYDVESKFYYLQSRYYDPELGRFLGADVVFDYDAGFPGFNLFAYCGNDPINRIDISGTDSISIDDLDLTDD